MPIRSLAAIGSCRISLPARHNAAALGVELRDSRVYGYTHTAAEALQQIRFSSGDASLPAELAPLLFPKGLADAAPQAPADLTLVEVSSGKDLRVGGTPVQLNYFNVHFRAFLSDPARARAFWQAARDCAEARRQVLRESGWRARLSDMDRELLIATTCRPETPERLRAALADIRAAVPRVIFVTHCNALDAAGRPLATRAAFVRMLSEVLKDLGAEYVNPTAMMLAFGQGRAFLPEGASFTHYSEAFADFLFRGIWERAQNRSLPAPARLSGAHLADWIARTGAQRRPPVPGVVLDGVELVTGSLGNGGAERQLSRIAVELARRARLGGAAAGGIRGRVGVVASSLDPQRSRDFHLPALARAGVPVHEADRLPCQATEPSPDMRDLPRATQAGMRHLLPYLQHHQPDAAYIWQDGAVLAYAPAALAARVPNVVLSLRGMPPDQRPALSRPEYKPMYQALAEVPGVRFSANSATAARAYADWLDLRDDAIAVIPNAIESGLTSGTAESITAWQAFAAETADATFTLGGVFRFDANKRARLWLDAAAAALAVNARLRFVLVGGGAEYDAARSHAENLGIAHRILFVGPSSDVGYWLSRFDALCLLSRHEGLPNVLIEAQFAGLPVISTPAGGAAEAFLPGRSGILLPDAENPALRDIVDAIDRLHSTPQMASAMGGAGAEFARNRFALDRIAPATLDLLRPPALPEKRAIA